MLTESAEIETEPPLGVDVLELLFEHFHVADGVEHDVDDDGQRHEACYAQPRGIQQVRQCHKLDHTQTPVVNHGRKLWEKGYESPRIWSGGR